jgi:hypothetical protein
LKEGDGYKYEKFFMYQPDVNKLLKDVNECYNWHTLLQNKEHAMMLREFMTPIIERRSDGGESILTGKDRKYRALNQIFTTAQLHGGRPMQTKPFSILMFMPFGRRGLDGASLKIGELCRIWASFMYQSPYWRDNFVFLTLSVYQENKTPHITISSAVDKGICHREDFDTDLKTTIINIEREALKRGKGLVILSGDVAKMGISLPCVDVVFLMSNNKDADDIIQKMYRALTDNPPLKKDGFIVDLDIKRIIRAMFDYDMEKDKLRLVTKKIPNTEERLLKAFELCNWGEEAFVEDNPEKSFDDIMNEIKRKVISDLQAKVYSEYKENEYKLEKEQKDIIRNSKELRNLMLLALSTSASLKKGKRGKAATLLERGESIPVAPTLAKLDEERNESTAPPSQGPPKVLSPEEIEQKAIFIIKTFVNTLVIKSAEPWSSGTMNLAALLQTYEKDAQELSGKWPIECNCSKDGDCRVEHTNLYEAAVCELRVYANDIDGKYSESIHKQIMNFVALSFENSTLIVEWNIYIERLLKDIEEAKQVKVGGKRIKQRWWKTKKIYRG